MKKVIIILLLCIPIAANAANYYVGTNGNDNNPGTLSQPWATWQKGFKSISAGDILFIRGGTYNVMQGLGGGNYCGVRIASKSGTAGAHITVMAYQNEVPILDCSALTGLEGYHRGILMENSNYWDFYGLVISNVREWSGNVKAYTGSAWEINTVSNVTIEHCDVTYCMNGFTLTGLITNLNYINCDSYENWDIYQGGDLCNGFNGNVAAGSTVNYTGCRAWKNSDDGFDNMAGGGKLTYNNCWAFNNKPWHGGDGAGNGDGFKLGFSNKSYESGKMRTLHNCISAYNGLMGFDESMDSPCSMDMELYNCVAYNNNDYYSGFRFQSSNNSGKVTLRNNIAIIPTTGSHVPYAGRISNVSDHNTWDGGVTATDADFESVDMRQLSASRKTDGSLPDITAFHLVAGSDLIDKGVNAGLPFSGKAPDLGAFEQQASAATGTPPVFKSGVVENETPSLLALTYDIDLNNLVIPATSSFSVSVNSAAITVNSVAISGAKVQLNLASVIKSGDIIAVSYTKPANNPLQAAKGGEAASISSQTIINHITATAVGTVPAITMTITPNPVHRYINIIFAYATTFSKQDPSVSPQIIRILDVSGKLFIEKLLVTGIANIKFPINLRSGIYTVMVLSGGINISSQKLLVYR